MRCSPRPCCIRPSPRRSIKAGITPHYCANITGHGWRKLLRHPAEHRYRIHTVPEVTPVLKFIQQHAHQDDREAYSTLNMGAGFAIFVRGRRRAAHRRGRAGARHRGARCRAGRSRSEGTADRAAGHPLRQRRPATALMVFSPTSHLRLLFAALIVALLTGCAGVLPQVERTPSTTLVAPPEAPLAAISREAGIPARPLRRLAVAAGELCARRAPGDDRARHHLARPAVLPDRRRLDRPADPARVARRGAARRARAAAGGRPLHHRHGPPAARAGGAPECRGAAVQPLRHGARILAVPADRPGARLQAAQPPHAQQALHRRRRAGGRRRPQPGRRVLSARHAGQLHRLRPAR